MPRAFVPGHDRAASGQSAIFDPTTLNAAATAAPRSTPFLIESRLGDREVPAEGSGSPAPSPFESGY
jgi:hypothetical protein